MQTSAAAYCVQMAQRPWFVPVPGTRKLERLEENLAAVDVDLTLGELQRIDEATSQIQIRGARFPAQLGQGPRVSGSNAGASTLTGSNPRQLTRSLAGSQAPFWRAGVTQSMSIPSSGTSGVLDGSSRKPTRS
jgi:hypothetical protein